MKILIFSDSHGDLKNMKKAINHFSDIKTLIHPLQIFGKSRRYFNIKPRQYFKA